ncbi:hypothetical protein HOU02_gp498 [Caulobacter phage CcrBL9]|uniref:Uncharacterized protein n=1 Tax=Caulobacter phage CcrBL9 TaxID=2283270 RepID=A0A385EEI8_9CAUD|nr:hypothetical protein HOU02_gp498 [Caulobacter phage CcrBL9]AXQ69227.1 hypothetical protein CcrBL9_gp203 [Caulobacter phage CcrBL9]
MMGWEPIYALIGLLVYVGIIAYLLLDPSEDDEKWQFLLWGMVIGLMWGPLLALAIVFGVIPEGFKALHRWIHKDRSKPIPPPPKKVTPAGKLAIDKD